MLNFREAALHVVERADIGAIELVLLDRGQTVSTAVLAPVQALTVASRIRDQRVARGRGRRRGERPMTAAAGIFCRAWPEGAEAYVHVSGNRELQLVEVVVLGLGRSNVLVLAPREALAFAETLRRAAVEAGHAEDAP